MKDLVLKKKYQEILSSNGINDEISQVVEISPENLIGEHMGSICEYITVKFARENCPPKELFVKKLYPVMPNPQQEAMMKTAMVNEGKFLTAYVTEMKNFCTERIGTEHDVDLDSLFPKTYYADNDEIIMENMTAQGYFMLNKKELQNFDMASLVMKGLAKLHGISYCLIKQGGGRNLYLEKNPNFSEMLFSPEMVGMVSNMFEPSFVSILKMMEQNETKSVLGAFNKLNSYKGKLAHSMSEAVHSPSLFDVVNHGDCWNNNMMFSPETRTNPEDARLLFVDFQMTRLGSPCLDIGYYIFTSTKPEVRKRTKELLKIYFDEISKLVKKLGEDFPFTFEEFLLEYGVKSKMGFLFGLMISCALDAIKSHDTTKSSGNIVDELQSLMATWIKNNPDKAEEIVKDIEQRVEHFEMFGKL
jgi:hypothetical protein